MIRFLCGACRKTLKAPDDWAGRKTTCPRCGQRLLIPPPVPIQARVKNETVLGEPVPHVAAVPAPLRAPSHAPADAFDPDSLAVLGLVKDSQLEGKPPELRDHNQARPGAWQPYLFGLAAFLLGVGALPAAIGFSANLLGASLAALGLLFGLFAFASSVTKQGAGLGLSALSALACGAALLGTVWLAGGLDRLLMRQIDQRADAGDPRKDGQQASPHVPPQKAPPKQGDPNKVGRKGGLDVQPARSPAKSPEKRSDSPRPPARPGPIRLSGVHQSGFPAQQRSDIDLWMDNPVEADTKWKGKIVEVEMHVGDLRIITHKDNAALATPSDGIWGTAWQLAFFVFRGEKRKQLIGFQNHSGVVVIRGKCMGLKGTPSYATFDDCELIKKSKGDQRAQKEKPRQGQQDIKPAKFDPSDLQRTAEWAETAMEEIGKNADNALRRKTASEKFDTEAKSHIGKKVRWRLKVTSIGEKFVRLQYACFGKGRISRLHLESHDSKFGPVLEVGTDISAEKGAELNPGDTIVITAKVVNIRKEQEVYEDFNVRTTVKIVLGDLKTE
jgi:hypothetical protein